MAVRFAPSPTGKFHIGNLRTAFISERLARALEMPWVVRFEDIDVLRSVPGAQEDQLADMKALGLVPDRIYIQSHRHERHWQLFEKAVREGSVYPCNCSRKDVRDALDGLASAPNGPDHAIYSGQCRNHPPVTQNGLPTIAWRFRNMTDPQGGQDFIVARTALLIPDKKSFTPAYHWACAIDDADGAYRLLVRSHDLQSATPLQRQIMHWMKCTPPAVFHTALVTQEDGHRLEKRTKGMTLAELVTAGYEPGHIVKLLERSFTDPSASFKDGLIFGETRTTLKVSELLQS